MDRETVLAWDLLLVMAHQCQSQIRRRGSILDPEVSILDPEVNLSRKRIQRFFLIEHEIIEIIYKLKTVMIYNTFLNFICNYRRIDQL